MDLADKIILKIADNEKALIHLKTINEEIKSIDGKTYTKIEEECSKDYIKYLVKEIKQIIGEIK